MAPSEAELHLGKVDPDRAGATRKPLGYRDTGSATRIENTSPPWKADNEIVQQRNVGQIAPT